MLFQWIDVLKLIAKALEENDIRYTHLYEHGKKFEVRNTPTNAHTRTHARMYAHARTHVCTHTHI